MDETLKAALAEIGTKFEAALNALAQKMSKLEDDKLTQRLRALEEAAELARVNQPANAAGAKSVGQAIVESEGFKSLMRNGEIRLGKGQVVSVQVTKNTILGNVTGASGGPLVPPDRQPGIVPGAFRTLRVVEALPSGTTTSNMIEYAQEASFSNAAVETSEGESKPESTLTFTLVDAPVRTIPTFLRASKQILSDASALQSYIDARLRHAVLQRLETQVISGNGTTPNLAGMLKSGNFTGFTPVTGENGFDSVNRAKYEVIATDFEADTVILNPADWGAMERTKQGTEGDGAYVGSIAAGYVAGGLASAVLWGLRVVLSNSVTAGTFIVLASTAVQVFVRDDVTVNVYEQDADNVTKNLVTILAEMRAAFCVYRPAAIVSGPLTQ